jgi:hypothetical protein
MSVKYKIIQSMDFIKAKPSGDIDLEESKKVLAQIAAMLQIGDDFEVLIDVRDAYGNLGQEELCELVLEFGKHREAFRSKIAVIAREGDQFNKAVFVEMCANLDGFQIFAFTDFEDATDWLQSDGGVGDLWLES